MVHNVGLVKNYKIFNIISLFLFTFINIIFIFVFKIIMLLLILKTIIFGLSLLFSVLSILKTFVIVKNKKGSVNFIIPIIFWTIFYLLNLI